MNSLRSRRLLRLSRLCLPVNMPWERTLLAVMAVQLFQLGQGWAALFGALLVGNWVYWLSEKICAMPIDVFENWRKMSETEGLGDSQ